MRSLFKLSSLLMASALLGACGPAGDAGADSPEAEAVAGAEMESSTAAQEITCRLLNATHEEAMERPSPPGEAEIVLGDHVGKICYNRPSARDRVVEGGLIPFGEPWRLGANEATAIHLPFPARIGGIELEPGSYSLYAIAGESEWEFVLNSNADRWGIPINEAVRAADVGTFMATPQALTDPVEQFTIQWQARDAASGHLVLEWGNTSVEIEVALPGNEG